MFFGEVDVGYVKFRWLAHAAAFFIGLLGFSWALLSLCVLAQYFISPAQAAQIRGINDIDDFSKNDNREGALAFARTVRALTVQSSVFSGIWYLLGLGIKSLG